MKNTRKPKIKIESPQLRALRELREREYKQHMKEVFRKVGEASRGKVRVVNSHTVTMPQEDG